MLAKRALERKVVTGAMAEIALPPGATLVRGKRREDVGQLEGKAYKDTGVSFWTDTHITDDRVMVEWVVRAAPGTEVALTLRHDKARVVRSRVTLR